MNSTLYPGSGEHRMNSTFFRWMRISTCTALVACASLALGEHPRRSHGRVESATSTSASATVAGESGVVNINQASAEELARLPGVGPARAKAIIELRRSRPFQHPEEITKVAGIGRKMFGRMRPYIATAGLTTLKRRPKK